MEKNTLVFECIGIKDGGKFPIENTGRGKDISPEFIIKNLSPHAKSFIITLEDLSHPIKKFTHWVIWNIPASDKIAKNIPPGKIVSSLDGTMQGIGYGFHRYAGPKPPKRKSHRYCFTIYALDCKINLNPSSTKRKVLKTASDHIIQQGEVCGYFE
ncbi:MAG: YbhB/YbcL family Raf kinase inhibitor-like protein [Lachnospiraceae bacterium]|nr:YbhB/YbcL family Raf kinase inhibitor-like protein [Lachnospiraceae bacterium]